MTNLPITINTAPAQTSSKPASKDDAPQGSQEFGSVLARQVADSSTPSERNTDKDAKTSKDTKDAAAPSTVAESASNASIPPDIASVLPADMMAALLVQQNPGTAATAVTAATTATTATTATVSQLTANVATETNVSGISLVSTNSKENKLSPQALTANMPSPQTAMSAPNASRPSELATAKDEPAFTEALKAISKNDVATAISGNSPHGQNISEQLATAQQPAAITLSSIPTSNTPIITAATLSSQLTVSTPVHQAGWGNDFSQKITWLSTQHDQSAELHLNPPHLGPMDVALKISGDQATALFTSPHAAVREAIEQALPKLREMLADNGIMLGNATVSDQSSRKDQGDFARGQQENGNASGKTSDAAVSQQGGRVSNVSRHNGLVDTFA